MKLVKRATCWFLLDGISKIQLLTTGVQFDFAFPPKKKASLNFDSIRFIKRKAFTAFGIFKIDRIYLETTDKKISFFLNPEDSIQCYKLIKSKCLLNLENTH